MPAQPVTVRITSFGFLHGEVPGAHLVVDLRHHFRDPHVNPQLRHMTAYDAEVRSTVMNTAGIKPLMAGITAAVEAFLAGPSGDFPVDVALGCAGGRHRAGSTAMALAAIVAGDVETAGEVGGEELAQLAEQFVGRGIRVELVHRDLAKPVVER
ncbi:RapZ C-terminal domain-containing protein [Streptomyces malaysiensis]|uniref:RapZ C-terminal domain-containing protein n=1 Tax=Streptomyces malaysiensis TaxID=92644 RepID=UPI000AC8A3A9|nr:RNase adapter RapZ [Streptomyces sp. SPMA113]